MCIYVLSIAYDPLRDEIGTWTELGSSRASSYHAYSDYESSRVNTQPDFNVNLLRFNKIMNDTVRQNDSFLYYLYFY